MNTSNIALHHPCTGPAGARTGRAAVLCALLALLLIASPGFGGDDAPHLFTELDVFQLEYASAPQISPDGQQIVYVRNGMNIMQDRKQSSLWTIRRDGSDHRKLLSGEGNASSPRWSPQGDRIAYVARNGEEGSEIFVYWTATGQTARLTQLPKSPRGITWSPDGRWLAFSMLVADEPPKLVKPPKKPEGADWAPPPKVITRLYHEADGRGFLEPGHHHLFVLPADGGTPRQVTSGAFHHRETPSWTPDGRHLIFSANRNEDWEYEFINSEIYRLDLDDGSITALTSRSGPDESPVVSPDGRQIAFLGYEDRVQTYQVTNLYVMDLDGGNRRQITGDLDRSVDAPQWSADGRSLTLRYDDRGNSKVARVTLDGKVDVLADNLGGTSLGRPYGGGSFSVSGDGDIAFVSTTPRHPGEVTFRAAGSSAKAVTLTDLNGDLLPHRDLGQVEEIWYTSSHDQRRIQGWIVKPPGFDPERKYPLLMEIHGGPIANYGDRFSAEFQLFAAAGYVVFYANPRGSTGYGEEFGNLLHHDYPGHDYEDLISGVDAVLAEGFVDADQLYVTGGSAGGIMTAWIVGKTQRFRAAAVVKPVINWYSKALVADNYFYYHDYRYPGSPWENPDAYLKYSPISLVGQVETPTLVMVGTADLRTPLSESKQLYHALKLRRIETALVEIPGASHNIAARPSQLITKVAHVLAWFEKHNGEEPAESPSDD